MIQRASKNKGSLTRRLTNISITQWIAKYNAQDCQVETKSNSMSTKSRQIVKLLTEADKRSEKDITCKQRRN
jgi:hypothetical protein